MSKNRRKERDEIEEYFSELKRKNFPIWIIFILILITIISVIGYYYFIIDNPKNIFLEIINNNLLENKNNKINYKKANYEFELNTDIKTTKKEFLGSINILKEITLSGNVDIDLNTKESVTKLNSFYKGEKLIDIDIYSKDEKDIYFNLPNLYDKVIKITNEENKTEENKTEITKEDYEEIINILKKELTDMLQNATYKKEYTKHNNNYVKKISLILDEKLMIQFYNKLLNNNEFIENYSKITKNKIEDTKKEIQDEIDDLDNDISKISLYLSIKDNKFLMLESIDDEDRLVLSKEKNKYEYKIYDDSIIVCQGYLEFNKLNNLYEITFAIDDIEEEISIILNLDLSVEHDKDIETMDIKDYINHKDLTEKDMNKITDNLTKNKTLVSLFEDINSLTNKKQNKPIKLA